MKLKTLRILPFAAMALAGSALAGGLYVPFQDPHSLRENQDVVWRGDQKHVRVNPAFPDERDQGVFHYQDVRLDYRAFETPDRVYQAIFGDLRIDASQATDISLVWSPFFPRRLAGHAALLVRFAPGAVTSESETSPAAPVEGIVISIEARMKEGEKYGFLKGLKGEFPLIYSVSTLASYRQRCIDVYKSEMHRWQIKLSDNEVKAVALAAFETAQLDHRKGVYALTRRSCSTEFMDILIEGLKASQASSEVIADLEKTVKHTRDVDLDQVEEEAKTVGPKRPSFWRKFNPAFWLGITRDHVRRTTPRGIFVNPLMSLPAQLPGVLHRRKLLVDRKPYSVEIYKASPEEIAAAKAKKKKRSLFKRLIGKMTD